MLGQAGGEGGRATRQTPLPQSVVPQRRGVAWESAQDRVWMFLSIADSANVSTIGFTLGNVPREDWHHSSDRSDYFSVEMSILSGLTFKEFNTHPG